MRQFAFSQDVLEQIHRERCHHPHPRVQRKMEVLWLKSKGLTHADIAERAGVSRRSVQRYLDEFEQGGLDQVRRVPWQGKRTVRFVDAAHLVFGPFLGYLWCLVRVFVPGPSGRKRYNVLAALDAISHRVVRVSNLACINAESVCALLREGAAGGLKRPITLVLDNARYPKCQVPRRWLRRWASSCYTCRATRRTST